MELTNDQAYETMNSIKVFQNPQFGEIRTVLNESDEPLFCASDIAKALGYANPAKAVIDHCKGVTVLETPTKNQHDAMVMQPMKYIKEPDMYRLIMKSKAPNAEAFQDWVCEEVLPEIRKHGGYMIGLEDEETDALLARAMVLAHRTIARHEKRIKQQQNQIAAQTAVIKEQAVAINEMTPKVSYYDEILNNPGTVLITQIAKDYGMSGKQMNKTLHDLKIQYKQGGQWVLYAKYAYCGYVHSQTVPISEISVRMQTKWTQKGRLFLYDLLKSKGIKPLIEQ